MTMPPRNFTASLSVALGGGIGAVLRYQLGRVDDRLARARRRSPRFPWPTLAANVIGSLVMGLLAGWLARHGARRCEQLRLLLGVGLLGGFTTFSSLQPRNVLLVERGQAGQAASSMPLVSVLAGLVGALSSALIADAARRMSGRRRSSPVHRRRG